MTAVIQNFPLDHLFLLPLHAQNGRKKFSAKKVSTWLILLTKILATSSLVLRADGILPT